MNMYICEPNQYLQPIPVKTIDTFKSLIWAKRYYTYGDFELYMPADTNLLQFLRRDNLITRDDDESIMIIEDIGIETDAENGDFFIVKGRSIESILLRRVIEKPYYLKGSGSLNLFIRALVRNFQRGLLIVVDEYPRIPVTLSTQFTGCTLYDAINQLVQPMGVGFRMTVSTSLNLITLQLYEGKDNGVVFSPEFDNLINSKYEFDTMNEANYAYVAGEGEGYDRTVVSVDASNGATGLALRETYIDARDLSSNNGTISAQDYSEILQSRGLQKISEDFTPIQRFEAEVNPYSPFSYKTDWNLGDIVTVTNEYGVTANPRIVEIIESWDDTGYTVVPTFEALEVQQSSMLILRDSTGAVLRDSTGAILRVRE